MANYLCYDVYDLELTKVTDNSELRALLLQTTNRSIIVIEDIDCSVDLTADRLLKSSNTSTKRSSSLKEMGSRITSSTCGKNNNNNNNGEESGRVTLSGLLNFTDGLWSCCGEEKIIVFTTNHRHRVDPALVRCGRMDVHVSLGTCGVHAFKILAKNYLGIESHHALFDVVESCIRSGGALTPAHIGEVLLRNRGNVDLAMKEVVSAMQAKILSSREVMECDEMVITRSPESVVVVGSPENWDSSPGGRYGNGSKKRKEGPKANFLVRLRSLTKSDSGRKGV